MIAWDGETLAADKMANFSGVPCTTTKIHHINNCLVGYSGDSAIGLEMLEWFRKGADPEKFPAVQREKDDWVGLLVIQPNKSIWRYERSPYPISFEDKQFAIGSGRDFALAAMYLGKIAAEAVEVACKFDVNCGNGVDVLTFA